MHHVSAAFCPANAERSRGRLALILAACGSGELESVEEGMKAFTQIRGEYRPDPERHRLYQELLEQSDQLFHAVSGRRP